MGRWAELPTMFEETLAVLLRTRSDERRWALISHTARWPEDARAAAFRLLEARGPVQRTRGAEILGCLCSYQPERIVEFAQALTEAFDKEHDEDGLSFIFFSLHQAVEHEGERAPRLQDGKWEWLSLGSPDRPERSHVWDMFGTDRLRRAASLANSTDPSRRTELAIALGDFIGLDRVALDTLIELSRDPETEPRDWATFELAVSLSLLERPEANDPQVLDAIWARVDDAQCEIRNEVAYGLALRHDSRAFEVVDRHLRDPHEASPFVFDAAEELADPRLLPALEVIGEWWPQEEASWLEGALAACRGEVAAE